MGTSVNFSFLSCFCCLVSLKSLEVPIVINVVLFFSCKRTFREKQKSPLFFVFKMQKIFRRYLDVRRLSTVSRQVLLSYSGIEIRIGSSTSVSGQNSKLIMLRIFILISLAFILVMLTLFSIAILIIVKTSRELGRPKLYQETAK